MSNRTSVKKFFIYFHFESFINSFYGYLFLNSGNYLYINHSNPKGIKRFKKRQSCAFLIDARRTAGSAILTKAGAKRDHQMRADILRSVRGLNLAWSSEWLIVSGKLQASEQITKF